MKKTRFIPYGYTMRNGRLVIDHDEADIIRHIFDSYIQGASLKELAEELTAQKIPYTEKTDIWDKARIARIIDNAKYTGDDEYDAIIDEDTFEYAVSAKAARQRNTTEKECEGIALLRNRVRCEECGSPMVRRICSKRKIKESWTCTNDECGKRLRISDGDLLLKITLLMNRIIDNSELMIPKRSIRHKDSPTVAGLQREIENELNSGHPSEDFIITKVSDIASRLYQETDAQSMIAAQIARKRISLMNPQETFNCEYFSDLVSYISIGDSGRIMLHTKVDTEIAEREDDNASNQDTEENGDLD